MKLDKEALLEVVALLLEGLSTGTDISEKLRELDFVETKMGLDAELRLTQAYLAAHPRGGEWKDDEGTGEG